MLLLLLDLDEALAPPEQPMYFENLDLESIVTPVKTDIFINSLKEANYNSQEVEFLENGLCHGFDIQYEGPTERQSVSENILFSVGNKTILWNKIMKEVQLKRVAGPFKDVLFKSFAQSPIGLVPKAGDDRNETRLIFNLSYDFKHDGLQSINHFIPKEECSVKYRDVDYAIKMYFDLCKEDEKARARRENPDSDMRHNLNVKWTDKFNNHRRKRTVYAGKSDLKSAFRILGLSKNCWQWLVMKAQDPQTKDWFYFVDKCLPFGSSISCALFQRF